ncbi:hypothetical protein V501_09633 [Pseudogymnoascus sp. VKM F-4519 (FW-2642)]|nr:hypothetical protein V501_09633 [Pseudogymnoascus sp. VKM F-4519 (FW-2642)]
MLSAATAPGPAGLAVGQDGAHHPPPPSHPDWSPDGSLWGLQLRVYEIRPRSNPAGVLTVDGGGAARAMGVGWDGPGYYTGQHSATPHTILASPAHWIRNYGAPAINICRCFLEPQRCALTAPSTLLFLRSGLLRFRCSLAGGAESNPSNFAESGTRSLMTASTTPAQVIRAQLIGFPLNPLNRSSLLSVDLPQVFKTFSNLLNSIHHPFAGGRKSAPGSSSDLPHVK